MAQLDRYPGVDTQLDPTLPEISVDDHTDGQSIIVKQTGPDGGLESRFERQQDGSYTLTEFDNALTHDIHNFQAILRGSYQPSSDEEHAQVAETMRDQVNKLSSAHFPQGQSVACVWAVRTLVHMTLNRWITKTDGTAQFAAELEAGFGGSGFDQDDLPDGAIIISPTRKGRHGHVGLLGAKLQLGDRLIYSNSSAHGVWMQNWTLKRWYPHYRDGLKLDVLFYPLPMPNGLGIS